MSLTLGIFYCNNLHQFKPVHKNMLDKYIQSIINTMWIVVSNILPLQSLLEYTNSWKINRVNQKIPSPRDIVFPSLVWVKSVADVKHSNPMRKTTKAMKKVWTIIICRFIKCMDFSSSFQLKYFGKKICINANTSNKTPIMFNCKCIVNCTWKLT